MDPALIAALLALGAVVGFLAGLLGLGGGMTMVPLLTLVFTRRGFRTGARRAHGDRDGDRHDPVHVGRFDARASAARRDPLAGRRRAWHRESSSVPSSGPQIVGGMSTGWLSAFFGAFVAIAATNILRDRKPSPSRQLPGRSGLIAVGGGIGLISSMVGAGGAFLSVPFMRACNVAMRNCVATSAALGLPIAAAGTIGFVVAGFPRSGLPRYTVGYVYLPALLAIVAASVISAPIGARAAHRWPVRKLRRAFAILLYMLAAYMLWKSFGTWRP